MVNKATIEDERLSWEARGVLAYILSKPDNWEVRTTDLLGKAPNCKIDKLQRILKELESAGYLVRERVHTADGRFGWVSQVYENPLDAAEVQAKVGKRRRRTNAQPLPENPVMVTAPPLPEKPVMVKPQQEAKTPITGKTSNGTITGFTTRGKPPHIVNTDSSSPNGEESIAQSALDMGALETKQEPKASAPPAVIQALADLCKIDRKVATRIQHTNLAQAAGTFWSAAKKQHKSEAELLEAFAWFGRWWPKFWKGESGEAPSLKNVREHWGEAMAARPKPKTNGAYPTTKQPEPPDIKSPQETAAAMLKKLKDRNHAPS